MNPGPSYVALAPLWFPFGHVMGSFWFAFLAFARLEFPAYFLSFDVVFGVVAYCITGGVAAPWLIAP